jgi:hypothetical protein
MSKKLIMIALLFESFSFLVGTLRGVESVLKHQDLCRAPIVGNGLLSFGNLVVMIDPGYQSGCWVMSKI